MSLCFAPMRTARVNLRIHVGRPHDARSAEAWSGGLSRVNLHMFSSRNAQFLVLVVGAMVLNLAGCAGRSIQMPIRAAGPQRDYIYFVEDDGAHDSRIKKCDILPDNSVRCTIQHDLASNRVP
jgi:hypothetical protein